jgi:hypothetical protein
LLRLQLRICITDTKEENQGMSNFGKLHRLVSAGATVLALALAAGCAADLSAEQTVDPSAGEPARTDAQEIPVDEFSLSMPLQMFTLENPTEKQRFERLRAVTLYEDGAATLFLPGVSSYLPPPCTYAYVGGELILHAAIESEREEGFYGLKNGAVVAIFAVESPDVLVFRSANVLLFADEGARYVFRQEFIVRPEPDAYALEQSNAPGIYLHTEKANATADAATVIYEASSGSFGRLENDRVLELGERRTIAAFEETNPVFWRPDESTEEGHTVAVVFVAGDETTLAQVTFTVKTDGFMYTLAPRSYLGAEYFAAVNADMAASQKRK